MTEPRILKFDPAQAPRRPRSRPSARRRRGISPRPSGRAEAVEFWRVFGPPFLPFDDLADGPPRPPPRAG